jgi:Fe-S-cluster containining protein
MNHLNPENFPCFRCGICCRKYQVRLTSAEAQNIGQQLKLDSAEFLSKYTDPRWPDPDTFLIRHRNGACIFLELGTGKKESRCLIHSFRPQDCRDWTPGLARPECQQGLAQWGLTINTNDEIAGTADTLREFKSFLNSLE